MMLSVPFPGIDWDHAAAWRSLTWLVSVGALVDDGRARVDSLFGKAGMRLGRPLHRRAGAIAPRVRIEICRPPDFTSPERIKGVSGQACTSAVGSSRLRRCPAAHPPTQKKTTPHRREATTTTRSVELHFSFGAKFFDTTLALRLSPAVSILVLRRNRPHCAVAWPWPGRCQRPCPGGPQSAERSRVERCWLT